MKFDRAAGIWRGTGGIALPPKISLDPVQLGGELCDAVSGAGTAAGLDHDRLHRVVWAGGRLQRLATYLGAKVVQVGEHGAEIRQGRLRLKVTALDRQSHPLSAPQRGTMARTIHESLTCTVRYQLWSDGQPLLDRTSAQASFEGMWL